MSAELVLLAEGLDPARGGGAERAIRATARALLASGVKVALAAPADRVGLAEEQVPTIAVPVAARSGRARALEVARSLAPFVRERAPRARLVACGKLLGADVLWSHGGAHAASRDAAARAGRGAVHGALARIARSFRPVEHVFDAIERENLARRELVLVALSERVRRDYERWHARTADHVVRNGVAVERFTLTPEERVRARERLSALAGGPGSPLALFVAHQFALKGLDRALRGIALVPEARLLVVGRGRAAPFARLAARLGIASRVAFAGEVPELHRLIGGADVLVHPTRYDPCSLVVLEAIAARVPVLTTAADGSSEVAGSALRDADDADELARALRAPPPVAAPRSIEDCARELLRVSCP